MCLCVRLNGNASLWGAGTSDIVKGSLGSATNKICVKRVPVQCIPGSHRRLVRVMPGSLKARRRRSPPGKELPWLRSKCPFCRQRSLTRLQRRPLVPLTLDSSWWISSASFSSRTSTSGSIPPCMRIAGGAARRARTLSKGSTRRFRIGNKKSAGPRKLIHPRPQHGVALSRGPRTHRLPPYSYSSPARQRPSARARRGSSSRRARARARPVSRHHDRYRIFKVKTLCKNGKETEQPAAART